MTKEEKIFIIDEFANALKNTKLECEQLNIDTINALQMTLPLIANDIAESLKSKIVTEKESNITLEQELKTGHWTEEEIMVKVDRELQTEVVNEYGADIQSTICMEECAELIQAISKMKRSCKNNKCDISELQNYRSNLIEEMADVYIILEQLKVIYNVTDDEIIKWLDAKQNRQRRLLSGGE